MPGARSFFPWAGGKRRMLKHILPMIPSDYNDYYEPFVGAGSLLFALAPSVAHINDCNPHLINAYRVLLETPTEKIVERLDAMFQEYQADKKTIYNRERDRLNEHYYTTPFDQACNFLFLMRTNFNGVFQMTRSGRYNTPHGCGTKRSICDPQVLQDAQKVLRSSVQTITHGSYKDILKNAKKGDFIYIDPPYHREGKKTPDRLYVPTPWTDDDFRELFHVFQELNRRGCLIIMSNSNTEFNRTLYKDYNVQAFSTRSTITRNRGKTVELLPNELVIRNFQ